MSLDFPGFRNDHLGKLRLIVTKHTNFITKYKTTMHPEDALVEARIHHARRAIETAMLTHTNLVEGLTQKLKDILQGEGVKGLASRVLIIGIDQDQLNEVIARNYDAKEKNLSMSAFTRDFLETIRRRFQEEDLIEAMKSELFDAPQMFLDTVVDVAKAHVDIRVLLYANFICNFDEDCAIIRTYKKILLAKKRQLSSIDKWGDVDIGPWLNVIREFSEEKLHIGAMEAPIFSMYSEGAKAHFSSILVGGLIGIRLIFFILLEESADEIAEETEITSGREYEISLSLKIKAAFPDFLVETTPASGDQGADIVVTTPKSKIVIQAKFYSAPVGNAAVQEVHASKSFYNASDCMVISTAGYTGAAKLLAAKTSVFLASDDDYIELLRCLTE